MQNIQWSLPIGALPDQNGVRFRVWAASASRVEVVLYDDEGERIRKENAAFLDQGPALVLDAR